MLLFIMQLEVFNLLNNVTRKTAYFCIHFSLWLGAGRTLKETVSLCDHEEFVEFMEFMELMELFS